MNIDFKEQVWKGQFRPTDASRDFEEKLRSAFGLAHRYEAARLLIGRSLREPNSPDPLPNTTKYYSKPIPGEYLFGDQLDLWMCALILDGKFGGKSTVEDFRALVEAHWARGHELVSLELEKCEGNEVKLVQRLADLLPEGGASVDVPFGVGGGEAGEIRLKIGSVSQTHPGGKAVDFVLNAPGTPPHIALMGAIGKGKTTTGIQMALDLVQQAGIPLLMIDSERRIRLRRARYWPVSLMGGKIQAIEMGTHPCLLDFLPSADAPTQKIARAAMQLRDTIALCCKSPGDLQRICSAQAIQDVIAGGGDHSLENIRDTYEQHLTANGKQPDSIVSRLNELTGMACFDPQMSASQVFQPIMGYQPERPARRVKAPFHLNDSGRDERLSFGSRGISCTGGFRVLRHLLILDEARKVLQEKKSDSLVDLIRLGRSKGSVVMLLSQDPSDFDGAADDFLSQIKTVVAFACAQSSRGLKSLEGVFGRKVQSQEFSDTYLTPGLAFVKLPGQQPERLRCWQPEA